MNDDSASVAELAARATDEVWVVIGRLRRRLMALDVDPECELSPAQASLLSRLDKYGPSTASDLAAIENVRPQSMAKHVIALEERGLVERHADPEDGRRRVVELTAAGRERRQGVRRARQAWLAGQFAERGSAEQLRAVITAMALLDEVTQA
ncbi:MarR family winged helix-turn-helix transcriptional regulator [Streptomyces sp. NPDC051684]|uniref:MarR family winged helix-turn-helix transcriptional regulator n=1 Tax=Streptomyces sp. NPDC051684 TaxID=3365670 RepID=UPI0037AD7EA4